MLTEQEKIEEQGYLLGLQEEIDWYRSFLVDTPRTREFFVELENRLEIAKQIYKKELEEE